MVPYSQLGIIKNALFPNPDLNSKNSSFIHEAFCDKLFDKLTKVSSANNSSSFEERPPTK